MSPAAAPQVHGRCDSWRLAAEDQTGIPAGGCSGHSQQALGKRGLCRLGAELGRGARLPEGKGSRG